MTSPAAASRFLAALKPNLGLIYAISAALLFSFKPILVKLIYVYDLSAITLLTWRMLISLPIYIVIGIIIWLRKPQRSSKNSKHLNWFFKATLVGMLGYYLASLLDLQGLQTITAQLERLILFSYPTWVAILSWLLLKTRLTKRIGVALLLSYIGIAVIMVSDWQQLGHGALVGSVWVLLSAIAFSLYIVLSKPIIDEIGAKEFTVIAMITSSIVALLHFALTQDWHQLIIPMPAFWLVVAMAILATVFPTFLMAAAISHLGPAKTAITGTIGPITTSLFAVLLLGEYFGWPQVFGLVLVIGAVSIMQSKPRVAVYARPED